MCRYATMVAEHHSDRSPGNPALLNDSVWQAVESAYRTRARRKEIRAAAGSLARPWGQLPDRRRRRHRSLRGDRWSWQMSILWDHANDVFQYVITAGFPDARNGVGVQFAMQ